MTEVTQCFTVIHGYQATVTYFLKKNNTNNDRGNTNLFHCDSQISGYSHILSKKNQHQQLQR